MCMMCAIHTICMWYMCSVVYITLYVHYAYAYANRMYVEERRKQKLANAEPKSRVCKTNICVLSSRFSYLHQKLFAWLLNSLIKRKSNTIHPFGYTFDILFRHTRPHTERHLLFTFVAFYRWIFEQVTSF